LAAAAVAGIGLATGTVAIARREPYVVRQRIAGKQHFEALEHDAALACFEASLAADPSDAETWFDYGRTKQRLGDYDVTVSHFRRANELKPDGRYVACIGFCGAVLEQMGMAADQLRKAESLGIDTAELFASAGYALSLLGDTPTAITYLKRAFDRDPALTSHLDLLVELLRWCFPIRRAARS
jgi:tetratricopeptide (TPR) repeat protein